MARRTTPTANKLLTIISDRLHIKKDWIQPETTFKELGLDADGKNALLSEIAEKFNQDMPAAKRERMKTVWNILQHIEGSDARDGKPAR